MIGGDFFFCFVFQRSSINSRESSVARPPSRSKRDTKAPRTNVAAAVELAQLEAERRLPPQRLKFMYLSVAADAGAVARTQEEAQCANSQSTAITRTARSRHRTDYRNARTLDEMFQSPHG